MKLFFLLYVFIIFFLTFNLTNGDFEDYTDYTLIDCIKGNDNTGNPFNSNLPFQSLKSGIESSIVYINSKYNNSQTIESASGIIFNIKVNCSLNNFLDKNINIDFLGANYNNELIIQGINENSLVFEDIKIKLTQNSGNLVFKNAKFIYYNSSIFYDFIPIGPYNGSHPLSKGIKITDSLIKLKNNNQLGSFSHYSIYIGTIYGRIRSTNHSHYSKAQSIENSILEIDIDKDYDFLMPTTIKNSKIKFSNKSGTGVNNIHFKEVGNPKSYINYNFSTFISNEINLGGNKFITDSSKNIGFLNNLFTNFNDFIFGSDTIFINNLIENDILLNISSNNNTYNNIFNFDYLETFDILNFRKNFLVSDIGAYGIGWFYKKGNGLKYFDIDISSYSLFKEITGQDIPVSENSIYITNQ